MAASVELVQVIVVVLYFPPECWRQRNRRHSVMIENLGSKAFLAERKTDDLTEK